MKATFEGFNHHNLEKSKKVIFLYLVIDNI